MLVFLYSLSQPTVMESACAVLYCNVACLAVPNYSTLSHESNNFRESIIEHKILIFLLLHKLQSILK